MKIDLSSIPIIDHHAHALLRQPPVAPVDWLQFFTEGRGAELVREQVPHLLFYRYAVKALAGLLNCAATPEAVFAERYRMGEKEWIRRLVQDAAIAVMLVDYGFQGQENFSPDEMKALMPCRLEAVLRLETLAQELILLVETCDDWLEAFSAQVSGARRAGYVALKSIIGYRTGLDIRSWPQPEVQAAFRAVKEEARREGKVRLAHPPLNDALVLRALEIAEQEEMPFQFHTGFGDTDADLRLVNPLHFRPLLQSERFAHVPWVLLHMGYPYVRESAYLASVYRNVYVDLSLAIPFAVAEAPLLLTQIFGLAPVNKVLYASDGFSVPELFWLGAKVGRSTLAKVLEQMIAEDIVTSTEALMFAEQVLYRNASQVYGVVLNP